MYAVLPCIYADDLADDELDVLCEDTGNSGDDSFVTPLSLLQEIIESNDTGDIESNDTDDDNDDNADNDGVDVHVLKPYIIDILEMSGDTMILIYVKPDRIRTVERPIPAYYAL